MFLSIKAVADVEKAIVEALDKQYADVLSPLKENLTPKKFGLKYVQKLTKRTVNPYTVPDEVCFRVCHIYFWFLKMQTYIKA